MLKGNPPVKVNTETGEIIPMIVKAASIFEEYENANGKDFFERRTSNPQSSNAWSIQWG